MITRAELLLLAECNTQVIEMHSRHAPLFLIQPLYFMGRPEDKPGKNSSQQSKPAKKEGYAAPGIYAANLGNMACDPIQYQIANNGKEALGRLPEQ
jgi:hypothetical protein